ncbi:MAG: diguanylate cyclase [Bacillota bacterium]|nr:diguanylate cyclase [Bacillota bacterium]
MDFENYKALLFKKIKKQISLWFEATGDLKIPNIEVYRFLHSISGSLGTFQLVGLYQLSQKLINQIEDKNEKIWGREELRNFLDELISLSNEYEHYQEIETNKEASREEKIPLIQIIDEDISIIILLRDALGKKGWMVVANTEPRKAITQYFELKPDCVIIETNFKNINGNQILHELQDHNNQQFVPKIMISLLNDRLTRLNAYQLGADDFIEKPIDLEEFIGRIERLLRKKKLYDQSVLLDDLTKLYNRKFLRNLYDRNLKELTRTNRPFSIALIDLDYFKTINDRFGHLTGDKVLVSFANFLIENTRGSDIVFRYGGEEFVILFQNSILEEAVETLKRLLNQFSEQSFEINNEKVSITFSAGVTSIQHSETSLESSLMLADQALYHAKESGRARIEFLALQSQEIKKKPLFVSIIDDDALIRTMLIKILSSMNTNQYEMNIKAFENGIDFFDSHRLEERSQHFLILDGVMPVIDGIEILQKVRKIKKDSNLYVLMLTGRKSESDIERALKLGADDYVTKPFSIKELRARIQRLIQRMN